MTPPPGRPDGQPATLRVVVDGGLCAGHGRCYDLAPEVFQDDAVGYSVVRGDGSVIGRLALLAETAARICPERAIRLLE